MVKVNGQRPENILLLVHEVFEDLISEFFRGTHYEYQLPCSDCVQLVSTRLYLLPPCHLLFLILFLHQLPPLFLLLLFFFLFLLFLFLFYWTN